VATALKLAGRQPFDLLLSDLGLPDGSGLDLMRALRAEGFGLPGIALSGYGQESDLQQSRDAGFACHLVKPVDVRRLKETIDRVIPGGRPVDPDR
jgi:CheY-like chemotaxis protein